jgi:predicted transposase YbfD/YdcC
MQSTPAATLRAIEQAIRPVAEAVPVTTLVAALAGVPDPRHPQWTRFSLPALLALTVAALLSNHLSVLAIAQWGQAQSREVLTALGFPDGVTPHQTTLHRLFRRLDPVPLAAALTACVAAKPDAATEPASAPPASPREGVAIDGKAQRGRLVGPDATAQTVHTVTLCAHRDAAVLAQVAVEATGAGVEAELSVAPGLLAQLDWRGRGLTGDALYCQRHLCQQVGDAGGDYLLTVKANQPILHDAIRLLFDPPPDDPTVAPPTDQRMVRQVSKGHGRLEVRTLIASTDLVPYLAWPGLAQVFRLERRWQEHGQPQPNQTVRYGITSLAPTEATPAQLLAWQRGHWTIENRLHHVCDVTLQEDASRVRRDHGPTVLAWLRRAALSLLRRAGHHASAQRLRYHSVHPEAALHLLGLPLPQRA